jgi:hypothetical protein
MSVTEEHACVAQSFGGLRTVAGRPVMGWFGPECGEATRTSELLAVVRRVSHHRLGPRTVAAWRAGRQVHYGETVECQGQHEEVSVAKRPRRPILSEQGRKITR